MTPDEKRDVFYAKDIHQINLVLGKFLQKSRADTVLLVDDAGHLVARQGKTSPASEDTITALVAGTYQATRAVAEIIDAEEFSSLVPCGPDHSILLLRAGDHALLAVTFDGRSSVTLIRTYALEAIRRVVALYEAPARKNADPEECIENQRFDSEIDEALTDVFG